MSELYLYLILLQDELEFCPFISFMFVIFTINYLVGVSEDNKTHASLSKKVRVSPFFKYGARARLSQHEVPLPHGVPLGAAGD